MKTIEILNELKMPASIDDAKDILLKYGYTQLGFSGNFASVFHKKGEKSVLKLFKKQDEGYEAFVNLARQHQNNPHFPKFSRGVVDIKDTQYKAVRTELLKECRRYEGEHDLRMFFQKEIVSAALQKKTKTL